MIAWRHLAALLTVLVAFAWAFATHAPTDAVCSAPFGACPVIVFAGEQTEDFPDVLGVARGPETPVLIADPMRPERLWLAYTQFVTHSSTVPSRWGRGGRYTATRLARSDDGGATWRVDSELWWVPFAWDLDGRLAMLGIEERTPSLAVVPGQGEPTWFAVRPRHRPESETAYLSVRRPAATTIQVVKAQGETPASLALGPRRAGSPTYAAVDLQAISPELSDCARFETPTVFAQGPTLYLIAECLVLDGNGAARARTVVVSTPHEGETKVWTWRYRGVLADDGTARELGVERLVSGTITLGRDGRLLFLAVPTDRISPRGHGCVFLEIDSLDPPRIARDAAGAPVVRTRLTGLGNSTSVRSACAYDPASATGMITVTATSAQRFQTELRATGLRP